MAEHHDRTVIGLGEVLWDMLHDGKQFGGAPANFACHARAMGADAHIVSAVGGDELGREILDTLDRLRLGREFVAVISDHPTGTVSVELDERGHPDYTIHEGVAWDFIPSMPGLEDLARRSDAVAFGSPAQRSATSRGTIQQFLEAAADDCLRVFDINLRQHYYDGETVAESLEHADVLKLNDEELPVVAKLLGLPSEETPFLDAVVDRYALELVALTKGKAGSVLQGPEGRSVEPGRSVEVADTVGAGDSFTAAVVMGLLADHDLTTINHRAVDVAAYVCTQAGATPEIPKDLLP